MFKLMVRSMLKSWADRLRSRARVALPLYGLSVIFVCAVSWWKNKPLLDSVLIGAVGGLPVLIGLLFPRWRYEDHFETLRK